MKTVKKTPQQFEMRAREEVFAAYVKTLAEIPGLSREPDSFSIDAEKTKDGWEVTVAIVYGKEESGGTGEGATLQEALVDAADALNYEGSEDDIVYSDEEAAEMLAGLLTGDFPDVDGQYQTPLRPQNQPMPPGALRPKRR